MIPTEHPQRLHPEGVSPNILVVMGIKANGRGSQDVVEQYLSTTILQAEKLFSKDPNCGERQPVDISKYIECEIASSFRSGGTPRDDIHEAMIASQAFEHHCLKLHFVCTHENL